MGEIIKSYKGFNPDMTCTPGSTPFQYEEGKEYEDSGASVCNHGFHACERPLDVFRYYPPGNSIYHEVEQSGEIDRGDDDSKVASSKIKIGARLDVAGLVKAQIEFTKSRTTTENVDPDHATAGNYGAATAGNCGAATAGNCGAATAGNYGAATSRGNSSTGKYGLSVARGNGVRVKGGMGSILVIAEENNFDFKVKDWKAAVVDGKEIKADTWYKLENGEFVEDGTI